MDVLFLIVHSEVDIIESPPLLMFFEYGIHYSADLRRIALIRTKAPRIYFYHQDLTYRKDEMNEIKVSVIVPIHGVGKYLRKCLKSLLEQDFSLPYEVLCLSDTPCDNSPEIIDEFVSIKPEVFKRIDVNNKNVSYTRNDGLKAARGEYVAFVDGDDFVSKDYISFFYKTAVEKSADIVIANFYLVKGGKRRKFLLSFIPYKGYISNRAAIKFMSNDVWIRGYLWYKFFKKDILKDCKLIDVKKTIEDLTFSSMAFINAKKIYWVQKRTYFYVIHDDSITKNWNPLKYVQLSMNFLAFTKIYAVAVYGNEKGTKFFNFSLLIRKFIFFYYVMVSKYHLKEKLKILKTLNKELRILKKHTTYTNSPWEAAIKEAGLNSVKEDIVLNKSDYIDLIQYSIDA